MEGLEVKTGRRVCAAVVLASLGVVLALYCSIIQTLTMVLGATAPGSYAVGGCQQQLGSVFYPASVGPEIPYHSNVSYKLSFIEEDTGCTHSWRLSDTALACFTEHSDDSYTYRKLIPDLTRPGAVAMPSGKPVMFKDLCGGVKPITPTYLE